MKKRIVWLTAAAMAFGLYARAEVVITSPTGLSDESDVVLESAVDAVKGIPADTVKAVSDVVLYTGDELRNTAHGVASAFKGDTPRESARQEMLAEVSGGWDGSGEIVFRSYKISPAVSKALQAKGVPQGAFLDTRNFFGDVSFPEGSSAYFQPEYEQLLVRNTLPNLLQIESMLAKYHHAELDYRQVEIKAKFIEVSQSTLNQLGFTWQLDDVIDGDGTRLFGDWQVNDNQPGEDGLGNEISAGLRTAAGAFGGNLGAGSMVMTKTGWMPLTLAIQALEQNSDSDTLSAPSLTTMDGKAAEIWVGEDRAVAKQFSVASDDVNIHIEHKFSGSPELMGVNFKVTPEIQANNLIRLKLNPKILDLIGYDDYRVAPSCSMLAVAGNGQRIQGSQSTGYPVPFIRELGISKAYDLLYESAVRQGASTVFLDRDRRADAMTDGWPMPAIHGQLPYFRVREIKTQVDVADGSTVGLGGLIYDRLETYKDKVPVLGSIPLIGRLFRSEGERSIKRNLMIFVSAGQVSNNGQRKSDMAINN